MLRINLLPVKKIKQQAEAWQQLKVFAVVFAALIALLIAIAFGLISKVNGLNDEITRLKAEEARLAAIQKQITELKSKKDAIEKQTKIVLDLEKTSARTARILDEVANRTPNERLWLTSLTQTGDKLNLNGIALDSQTVAEYIDTLKKLPSYITEVTLQNVSSVSQLGRNLKSFALACTVSAEQKKTEEAASEQNQGAAATPK
ncbi:PilN domain-containing protein [Candidatus Electronema sp. JM]|uniref:PilN domain-containing protein n=1 Tax=Candidatus Electronema sp. JM TaxID=3401571 RepID=UPI003AA97F05